MHLALARKYRPQNFLELVGQGPIVKTLQNVIASGRIHHAYLFSGVRGIGKTSMARILAKSINCETGPTITPCQTCQACESITNSNSLDVIEIDGASNNLVEDVRELREQVKFLPTSGKYKIIIIDEVHMLSNSAFNALLKTLEEPPAHVIFVFATTESHKIPMTILSRCQKYDFKKVTTSVLSEHLQIIAKAEDINITEDAICLITQCAQGSVRDGISLLDQIISFKTGQIKEDDVRQVLGLGDRVLMQDVFKSIITQDLSNGLEALNQVDARGIDLKLFAEGLLQSYRHLILLESTGKAPAGLSQSELEFFNQLKGALDLSLLLAQYQVMFQSIQELAYSEFPKTTFEIALVKLQQIQQMIGLSDLVQQIKNRQAPMTRQRQESSFQKPSGATYRSGNWYDLVKWITAQKPPLGTLLKDAVPVVFSDDKIEVAVSNESQAKAILLERSDAIKQIIDQHFGKSVNFSISDLSDEKKKPRV